MYLIFDQSIEYLRISNIEYQLPNNLQIIHSLYNGRGAVDDKSFANVINAINNFLDTIIRCL